MGALTTDVRSAAWKLYSAFRWPVIPLKRGTKRPALDWQQFQKRLPGEDELERWFGDDAPGLGLVTGSLAKVVVVDLDGEEGKASAKQLGLPATVESRTGSGGRHLFFAYPDKSVGCATRLLPGVDVRGEGGFIVLPPSSHPSGGTYTWTRPPGAYTFAPLPSKIIDLMHRQSPAPTLEGPLVEGHRNDMLTRLAGSLRRPGGSEEAILAALLAENRTRCRPPLSEQEVRRIAASVGRYPPAAAAPPKSLPDPESYFDHDHGFVPALLGAEVRTAGHLRVGLDGRLWRYRNGVYNSDGDAFVGKFVRERLGERYRRRHLDEVLSWCRQEFPSIPERPDPNTINVTNGLLDWQTGVLRPHDPEEPSIVQIPVRWDPDADCPLIERFLAEVILADARDLAFETAAYCLLPNQPLRRAVMLLGPGRNGKSVFLGLLRSLLGPQNTTSIPLQVLGDSRFAAAELFGKLANLCGDLDARALRRSDMFKMLTGGTDMITAERKYRDPFAFVPFATMVFSANEAPASSDQSDAYFDRWIVLPFDRRFSEEEADPHLLEKITTPEELTGFLFRAVDALADLMDRGRFDLPPSVREAGRTYRERIDTVMAFVLEGCEVTPEAKVKRSVLYRAYRTWCELNGRLPVSQQTFGPRLRQELGEHVADFKSGTWWWRGIGLAEQES